MPARSFTVFQDAQPAAKPPTALRPLGRSASASAVLTTSRRSGNNVVSLPEKENLHPLTGLSTSSVPAGKKRKASESNSVLAPKVLGITGSSGANKVKPKHSELKRKASSQTNSGKSKVKKETSKENGEYKKRSVVGTTSSSARVSRPGFRSASTTILEAIEEEVATQIVHEEELHLETKSITQSLIDSRCYELTVSPLADVSDAYLQSSESKGKDSRDEDFHTVKEESDLATQLRDYFMSEDFFLLSSKAPASATSAIIPTPSFSSSDELDASIASGFVAFEREGNGAGSMPVTPKKSHRLVRSLSLPGTPSKDLSKEKFDSSLPVGSVTLSTPERKELYATFTFMTPKSSPIRNM